MGKRLILNFHRIWDENVRLLFYIKPAGWYDDGLDDDTWSEVFGTGCLSDIP